jgi:hypothetical protein
VLLPGRFQDISRALDLLAGDINPAYRLRVTDVILLTAEDRDVADKVALKQIGAIELIEQRAQFGNSERLPNSVTGATVQH